MNYLDGGLGEVELLRELDSAVLRHVVLPHELLLESVELVPGEGRPVSADVRVHGLQLRLRGHG
jgi:hypothetical protein